MNGNFVCFYIFGMGLIVVLVLGCVVVFSHTRRINGQFRKLAKKYSGTFHREFALILSPKVEFEYENVKVRLDTHSAGANRRTYTRLHITWPDGELRCEVFPQKLANRDGRFFGTQDIEIGSPEFDKRFIIRGSSESLIRHLINERVQHAINEIREMAIARDVYLLWSNGVLLIKVHGILQEFPQLEHFTKLGLELYESALATQSLGIEFVGSMKMPDLSGGICQVCGEEINSQAVTCKSCRTPHHADCWEYYGQCSTYGCGQSDYRRA